MSQELNPRNKQLDDLVPNTQDLLADKVDGEVYEYKKNTLCKVCTSPEDIRLIVDKLLIYPKSYREILREARLYEEDLDVPEAARISYHSIRTHALNHLSVEKRNIRQTIEERAALKGKKVIDAGGTLLTPEAFYEVVIAKGFENIVNGLDSPTISQTMQAVALLQKLEEQTGRDYKPEVLVNQLNIIVMAIREVLPTEMREAVFKKIDEYSKKAQEPVSAIELEEAYEYIDDDLNLD
jgi:hypothetical protein